MKKTYYPNQVKVISCFKVKNKIIITTKYKKKEENKN